MDAEEQLNQKEREEIMKRYRENPNQFNRVPDILLADEEEINNQYAERDSNYDSQAQNASLHISQRLRNIGIHGKDSNLIQQEDPGSPRGDNKEQWLQEERVQC
jgi:hypothetical protein